MSAPPPDEAPAGRSLAAEVFIGVGVATRDALTPSNGGRRELVTGLFPAFDVGLQISTAPRGHTFFAGRLRYQSSFGLKAHETPSGGVLRTSPLRSHRLELGVMPGYRFTPSEQSTVFAVFVGWAARGLRPVDELSLPAYAFHGPCVRPELLFHFGDSVSLRLAPELMVLASVSEDLRNMGAITGLGLGFGVEGGLGVKATDTLAFALTYRESHVSASTDFFVAFDDAERFITLQGVVQY
jgi:hypothetical protein